MSTRSVVAIKNGDGSFDAIYCHNDGYTTGGVGDALRENHATVVKARAIIEAGDHSTIVGQCTPYAEMDGEDWIDIRPMRSLDEGDMKRMISDCDAEYLHTFVDGEWLHRKV